MKVTATKVLSSGSQITNGDNVLLRVSAIFRLMCTPVLVILVKTEEPFYCEYFLVKFIFPYSHPFEVLQSRGPLGICWNYEPKEKTKCFWYLVDHDAGEGSASCLDL